MPEKPNRENSPVLAESAEPGQSSAVQTPDLIQQMQIQQIWAGPDTLHFQSTLQGWDATGPGPTIWGEVLDTVSRALGFCFSLE